MYNKRFLKKTNKAINYDNIQFKTEIYKKIEIKISIKKMNIIILY